MSQESLGRLLNTVPSASGVALNLTQCSGVAFVTTNDCTITATISKVFASGYTQPSGWNPFTHYYQNTDNGVGTGVWTKQTQAASNAVVQASDYMTYVELMVNALPDGYKYVKFTVTAAQDGVDYAILYDLTVQRAPASLPAVSAA